MGEAQTMPKGTRYYFSFPVHLIAAFLLLVLPALTITVSEASNPGYGLWSQMLRTPEERAAAKAKEGNRIAAEKERVEAENKQVQAYNAGLEAEKQFIKLNVMNRSFKVDCPNPETWPTMGQEDRQRLRNLVLKKRNTLLLDWPFCP